MQNNNYFIIGNGRVAKHFQHYLDLLNIPYSRWSRQDQLKRLLENLESCTHILLLINDDAINLFIEKYLNNTKALIIHFSGSLITPKAYGAHPLMTFSKSLYNLEKYQRISFIVDHDAPSFETLLPGLPNPHYILNKAQKAKYHALCVLGGNFSCILWQKLLLSFEKEFDLPIEAAFPYLMQQTENLIQDYLHALSGPLMRKDTETINKNRAALQDDRALLLYQSFIEYYFNENEERR